MVYILKFGRDQLQLWRLSGQVDFDDDFEILYRTCVILWVGVEQVGDEQVGLTCVILWVGDVQVGDVQVGDVQVGLTCEILWVGDELVGGEQAGKSLRVGY